MQGLLYLLDRLGTELAQREMADQIAQAELADLRAQLGITPEQAERTDS